MQVTNAKQEQDLIKDNRLAISFTSVKHAQIRPDGKIRVLIADEHPIVGEGLVSLLGKQSEIEIVANVRNAADVIQVFEALLPDVVLVDFTPSPIPVIPIISKILATQSTARIVIFTASMNEQHIHATLKAGVKGYLHKTSSLDDIVSCIHTVFNGQAWVPQNIADVLARRLASPSLTRREQDVLIAMATGKSNKQIGVALQLSEGTVKVHVTHILEKLKVSGRTQALATAAVRGLVSLELTPAIKLAQEALTA